VTGVAVWLFGRVRVTAGGQEVDLGPARQRTLLAALAIDAGRPVPVEVLVDRIWGDAPPAAARDGLYAYMTRLRRAFSAAGAAGGPVRDGGGYRLDLVPDQVDLPRAQALVAAGRRECEPDDVRAAALGEALAVSAETALADLSGRWVTRVRDLATEQRLDAALLWAGLQLRLARPDLVVPALRELAGQHPLVEPLAARLIEALARDGRLAEALARYAETRRLLVEQLGTEPGTDLRRVHQAVLAGDLDGPGPDAPDPAGPDQAARAPATATAGRPPRGGQTGGTAAASTGIARRPAELPHAVDLTGREPELAALDAATGHTGRATAVAAVTGTAGVGKTALAVGWAQRSRWLFPDGQLYVDLRGYAAAAAVSPAAAVRGFLVGLGVPPARLPADPSAQAALYRSLLADRRVLVLVDNARDAEHARPLLPGTAGCLAVVTSRDRLSPLVAAGAHPVPVEPLSPAGSRALLAGRLGAGRVAAEPGAADRIAARCGHLPLALTIAAARAVQSGFPLEAIAAELADDPLGGLRDTVAWSYAALPPAAARLLRLVTLLPGPEFSAAEAVSAAGCGPADARRLLAALTHANLVTEPGPGRYRCHHLPRAHAAELLATADPPADRAAATARLADHLAAARAAS
jgi:DNA-binding SARP family transcriptional activator